MFVQHAFEDPEGRIDLPQVIQGNVECWKRPVDFIEDKVCYSNIFFAAAVCNDNLLQYLCLKMLHYIPTFDFLVSSDC